MSIDKIKQIDKDNSDHSGFIVGFIETFFDFATNIFRHESMHYKDLRMAGFDPKKIYANFNNLKTRGLLEKHGKDNFIFTKKGIGWAKKSVKRYFPLRQKDWDGKWRMVIFDVPQELHLARISFRKRLKSLGFYTLQKSVFVIPYPCEDELGPICQNLKISEYVEVIIADKIGSREEEIKKYYHLF